jgi:hypothetical protein
MIDPLALVHAIGCPRPEDKQSLRSGRSGDGTLGCSLHRKKVKEVKDFTTKTRRTRRGGNISASRPPVHIPHEVHQCLLRVLRVFVVKSLLARFIMSEPKRSVVRPSSGGSNPRAAGIKRSFSLAPYKFGLPHGARGAGQKPWDWNAIADGDQRRLRVPSTMSRHRATCLRFQTPNGYARKRPALGVACARGGATTTADSMNGTTCMDGLRYMIGVAGILGNSTQ